VHAQGISVVAESAAADALIVSHRASNATIAAERREWYGSAGSESTTAGTAAPAATGLTSLPRVAGVAGAVALVRRHASVRSVWFLNSLRGAVALAAAVAVADLSGVQHAFWVVLGTLSVLRTSAASTGSTAWRALAGTVVGFVVGGALLVGIGTAQDALWVVFPLAILIAAYAPGTTPFLVGQAAFTVTIVVLFNLLVPAGWRVGLLRVEDVAIGCGVSLVVGVLFWPRGVSSVVGDDLADTFRAGAAYLTQAVDWALSELLVPPAAAVAAASAGIRLDDAVRGLLTEQGSKRVSKDDLWALINASTRLRLTAHTLAGLRTAAPAPGADDRLGAACLPLAGSDEYAGAPACVMLRSVAGNLAGFYDAVADEIGHPGHGSLALVPLPAMTGPAVPRHPPGESAQEAQQAGAGGAGTRAVIAPAHQLPHPHLLWVQEHLHHLSASAQTVSEPALRLAEVRQRPWWR
jgi:hypothetical protein